MIKKYVTKPVTIEAIQFTRDNWKEVKEFSKNSFRGVSIERRPNGECFCMIDTLEGVMQAKENDYIIKGLKGEFYPCKPDIFKMKYEPYTTDATIHPTTYLTPEAVRQIVKEELNKLYGSKSMSEPTGCDGSLKWQTKSAPIANVRGIVSDLAGNLTITADMIRSIGVDIAKVSSFTPEAFYKKEDDENSHLNVYGNSTDGEDWEDYPED